MSEQTAVAAPTKTKVNVPEFEIEFGDDSSNTIRVTTLGLSFRGKWSRYKLDGNEVSLSGVMTMMPDVPGLHMRVVQKESKVVVTDPLEKNPQLCRQISHILSQKIVGFDREITHVNPTTTVLDEDRFKTLLYELRGAMHSPQPTFEVVSGQFPSEEQIDSLPGRELNDVGNDSKRKAKYKDDAEPWVAILEAMRQSGALRMMTGAN